MKKLLTMFAKLSKFNIHSMKKQHNEANETSNTILPPLEYKVPLLESQRHSQFLITSAPELEAICMHVCMHACVCEDLSQRLYFTRLQRKPAMCFTLSPRSMTSVSRVIFSFFRAQSKLWEHPLAFPIRPALSPY